jgi:hemerythrin-like metal-binding protein
VLLYTPASGSRIKNKSGVRDLSFVRLVWHRSYKCGEASIDQEHHELFDRANSLIQAVMSDEENQKPVSRELDDLIDCVQRHFTNEEAILARYQFAELEDHALQHQILVGRALELRRLADAGELTLGDLVTFLVQDVVVKHMLKEDRMFFSLFRNGLSRAQPEFALGLHDSQA